MLRRSISGLILFAFLGAADLHAQAIYKCMDAKGAEVYSDKPCGKDAKVVNERQARASLGACKYGDDQIPQGSPQWPECHRIWQAEVDRRIAADRDKWRADKLARGVDPDRPVTIVRPFIGMSKEQTRDSDYKQFDWGRPMRVNTTRTKAGQVEQWVFGDGRYLYFTNDVLTAIQE